MLRKRFPYLIVIATFLIGIFGGSFVDFLNPVGISNAETIILSKTNKSFSKEDISTSIIKIDSTGDLGAIGLSSNNKLLIFKDSTLKPIEGDKILDTVLLEEISEDGEVYTTYEIQFKMDKYNSLLVSDYMMYEPNFIDNVRYTILLSPDKEKVLVSSEVIDTKEIDEEQYRITNKGYSAIYNLRTGEITYIEDNSKFVRWSSDSNYVFGINYAACYQKYEPSPYDQHFFPAYTYRNVSYNIERKKIDVITEDIDLYDSLKIDKDTYDNILNNPDLNEGRRFLIGYTDTNTILESSFKVEKLSFSDNPYNLNYIIDINKEGQYIFVGNDNLAPNTHGMPAIYIGNKGNGQKEKIYEAFMFNDSKSIISETKLFYSGHPLGHSSLGYNHGLYMYDMKSGKDILLYEGDVSFTYSPDSKMIAIYDTVQKDVFIGKLVENKIINLKSYYKVKTNISEMHFNQDGSKLYFEGSTDDRDGVIYLESEKM